jgi:hypothetical protein
MVVRPEDSESEWWQRDFASAPAMSVRLVYTNMEQGQVVEQVTLLKRGRAKHGALVQHAHLTTPVWNESLVAALGYAITNLSVEASIYTLNEEGYITNEFWGHPRWVRTLVVTPPGGGGRGRENGEGGGAGACGLEGVGPRSWTKKELDQGSGASQGHGKGDL